MIIQSKAGFTRPAWCPYAQDGIPCGHCPYCEKARTQARLGQLALVAGDVRGYSVRGFGAFGARSYTTPQVECSVAVYDGKPGGWQAWCDCMFAPTDPNRAKCRKRPCANPFDSDPDCVFGITDPALAFAPWTDPGAGIRGIPKEGGGLLYLFGSSFAPAEPRELEPHNFLLIADRDPLRGAFLIASAPKVLASPAARQYSFADPLWQLQAHYLMMGAPLANIPLVGGVMTFQNAVQLFLPAGPLAWAAQRAAFQYSLKKDPSGELFVTVVKPVLDARATDLIGLLTGGASAIAGDVGGLATVVKVLARRAARMLPVTGASDVEVARALLNAAADAAPMIANVIKDPATAFTTSALYESLGETLKRVSTAVANMGDKALAGNLFLIGDTVKRLAPSISAAAQGIATGNPARLCCDVDSAFDLLPVNYMGIKVSGLTAIAANLAKAGVSTSSAIQSATLGADSAKTAMRAMQDGINAISLFATELDKALSGFGQVGKYFADAVRQIVEQKGKLDALANAAKSGDPAAAIATTSNLRVSLQTRGAFDLRTFSPDNLARVLPGMLQTLPQPGPVATPLPGVSSLKLLGPNFTSTSGPVTGPAQQTGGAGLLLAGAGAGFVVGGPVGAAVGAGAALLLGGKK